MTSAPRSPSSLPANAAWSLASSTTRMPGQRPVRAHGPQITSSAREVCDLVGARARGCRGTRCRCAHRGTARRVRSPNRWRRGAREGRRRGRHPSPDGARRATSPTPRSRRRARCGPPGAPPPRPERRRPAATRRCRSGRAPRPTSRADRRARSPARDARRASRTSDQSDHGSPTTRAMRAPVVVVAARDRDPVVVALRRVDVVRRHRGELAVVAVGHAVAPCRPAVHREVEQRGPVERDPGFDRRHVDPLPGAGAVAVQQRGEDRHGHEVPAVVVHERVAPARRREIGEPRGRGEPADRLGDRAPALVGPVRALVPEAGVRHVDDVGADRPQLVVREAEPGEHAGREVLGDDVGDRDQPADELAAALGAQVDGDAELLDVVVVERAAHVDALAVVDERRHAAQDVPPAALHRVFDPDHLRAERGESARRARARELTREVADAEVRERGRRHDGSRP